MRREIHDKLEEERSRLLVKQTVIIQRVLRGHAARKLVKELRRMRGVRTLHPTPYTLHPTPYTLHPAP